MKYKIFKSELFNECLGTMSVWMSHGDETVKPPKGFEVTAYTDSGIIAGIESKGHGPTPEGQGNIYCVDCNEAVVI